MPRSLRLVPLAIAVVITQVSIFPELRLFGVVPDLGLVVALAVAWHDGPEAGAWFGFAVGLSFDLFLATPLGVSAISYALVAYALGTLRPLFDGRIGWLTVGFGFVSGLVGGTLSRAVHDSQRRRPAPATPHVGNRGQQRPLRRAAGADRVRARGPDHPVAVALSLTTPLAFADTPLALARAGVVDHS